MKKLISSSEAAEILGLSLQGIHYRIKKGQLESVKQDGKIYVYLDQEVIQKQQENGHTTLQNTSANDPKPTVENQTNMIDEFQKIALRSKDEQIAILKHTLKLIRRQYKAEIHRLDKNHKQTLKVFQSEVELLKSAFSEMKNIYQLEHKKESPRTVKKETIRPASRFMNIQDFYLYMKKYHKTNSQIKDMIIQRIKKEDKRFIYNKKTKEVLIQKSDFYDLI